MCAMTYELSREHEEFRRSRPRVRGGRDRTARRAVGPRPPLPDRRGAADGQARADGPHRAGGVRRCRRGRRLHQPLRGDRGDRPRRPVDGHHPRGGGRTRHQPDPDLRHRRAEGAVAPRPRRRARPWPASASPSPVPARTPAPRAHGPSWSTASGSSTAPSSSSPTPGSDITSCVTVTARTGLDATGEGSPRSRRSSCRRHARVHRGAGVRQARLARLRHPPAQLDDVHVPEANLLGERGRGFAQFLATLDDGRIAIAALAVGCIQACLDAVPAVRRRAADVRRPDRSQAGRRLPDRRPRGDAAGQPPAGLQGGGDQGRDA